LACEEVVVKFLVALAICLGAVMALIHAQETPSTGSIHGYVLSRDQEVVGDALIKVGDGPSRQGASVRSRGRGSVAYDGGFFIPHLSPGNYTIEVTHEKYAPRTYESLAVEAGKGTYVVAELDPLSDIAGGIRGYVSIKGISVKDLVVQCRKGDGEEVLDSVKLKEDGKFEFTNVLPGTYVIVVLKARDEIYTSKSLKVVKKKKLTHKIKLSPELFMDKPGTISGKVVGPDYKAVSGASISFIKMPPGQKKVSTKTDSDGKYEISNLRPGPYEIRATKSGIGEDTKRVTVRSGRGSKANLYLKKK
jgi:hypothetical protein